MKKRISNVMAREFFFLSHFILQKKKKKLYEKEN